MTMVGTDSYVAVYGLLAGHIGDYERWASENGAHVLEPQGRGLDAREHIYTASMTLWPNASPTRRL